MPLLVPGINNNSGNDLQNWQMKLMGKSISGDHSETSFKESDLPAQRRILKPGQDVVTMDHNPERLNVHINEQGTVEKVTYG